ncbi:MAG: PAS domain S-box protein, partial [Verrucomicrobiaceae bacterium]
MTMLRRPSSFVRALTLRVEAAVAVLGLALLATMVWQGNSSTKEAEKHEVRHILDRATERLRALIRSAETAAESVERAVRHTGVTRDNLRAVLETSLAAFEQHPHLSYIGIILPETGEYGTLERTATGEILLWLWPGTRTDDPVVRISVLTGKGFVLREERPADGYDPRSRPFFHAALASPSGGWMSAYRWIVRDGSSEPLWGFSYVKAVRDETGRIVCVLDTDYDIPALNRFLEPLAKGYNCGLQIVELGETPRLIGGPAVKREPLPLPPPPQSVPLPGISGGAFVDRITLEGEPHWVAADRLGLSGGVSWQVMALRRDTFIAPILRRQLYHVIGMGGVTLAGIMLISARMARRLGKPLTALGQCVAGIESQRDPATPLVVTEPGPPVREFRETELLSNALAHMATGIQHRESELTARNRQLLEVERQLRRERDYAEAVITSLPGVFYHCDGNLRLRRWNRNFERVTGYSAEELSSMHALRFFTAKDRERVSQSIPEACEKGGFQAEADFLLKDGQHLPYLFLGRRFEENGHTGYVGMGLDLTERKRMEDTLREKTALFEAVVERAPDGILVVDRHGRKVIQNQRLSEQWGIPPRIAGNPDNAPQVEHFLECVRNPEDTTAATALFGNKQDNVTRCEIELLNGSTLACFSTPVLDREGCYYGRLWAFRDITLERDRERRLAAAFAQEKELAEKASAADNAKSEFLAVMSHEIRTPLNAILGFAELLQLSPGLPPAEEEHVRIIAESGKALLRLLDDILSYSRLGAGRAAMAATVFQPRALLEDIRLPLAPQADAAAIQLHVECAPDVPDKLEGDTDRLRQVIINLASNALKFTAEGSVRIGLAPLAGNPGTYVFSVTDTGCGIAQDKFGHIFQPFTQIDSSFSRSHGGTGLGLAISRRIAEFLGGSLTVESQPGKGSEFRVAVPLREAVVPEPPVDAQSPSPMPFDAGFACSHPFRILIVEDDKINMMLVRKMIRRLGYDPLSCGNGREAVELFHRESPDFLLMDLQMPEMDGIEATREIRRLEKASQTAQPAIIVALTANT